MVGSTPATWGDVDEDGYVWITGRKKELIVTSAGKNISPVLLESLLTGDSLIEQAMVIGDDRSFLTAHCLFRTSNTSASYYRRSRLRPDRSGECITPTGGAGAIWPNVSKQCLLDVSYHEQVRRFALLERPFSIEQGEMTPKLSLRREIVQQHFRRRDRADVREVIVRTARADAAR